MPESKHTPGPWKIDEQEDGSILGIWDNNPEPYETKCVAMMDASNDSLVSTKEMWANAHLIAAAPDLLEACEKAFERLSYINKSYPLNDTWRMMCDLKGLIAKAKGEE